MSLSGKLVATLFALKLPHALMATHMDVELLDGLEGLATYLATVRAVLLVLAGNMAEHWSLLCEALVTELTAVRSLSRVGAVVLVKTGLCPEGLPTEVALMGLLSSVNPQVHVKVSLLGECTVAVLTHKWALVSVNGFDMHLQAVSAGGSMVTLLTHKKLLAAMLGRLMQTQLCFRQVCFAAQRACMWFGCTVDFDFVTS